MPRVGAVRVHLGVRVDLVERDPPYPAHGRAHVPVAQLAALIAHQRDRHQKAALVAARGHRHDASASGTGAGTMGLCGNKEKILSFDELDKIGDPARLHDVCDFHALIAH